MTDVASSSYEQESWLTVSREIETELLQGFTGEITLHCLHGVVESYHINERRKPGHERRTAGPRDTPERRKS